MDADTTAPPDPRSPEPLAPASFPEAPRRDGETSVPKATSTSGAASASQATPAACGTPAARTASASSDTPADPPQPSPCDDAANPFEEDRPETFDAPPQFRLSTLLWGVAAAAVALAFARQLGGWALVGAGWFGVMIFAHLAATACGHRTYGRASSLRRPLRMPPENVDAAPSPPRPPTLFEERRLRHEKLSLAAAVAGAVFGMSLGCGHILSQPWTSRSFNGLVVTALSLAVLGGLIGWGLACPVRFFLSGRESRGERP